MSACLFSWGANSHGQLGHGNIPEEELLRPREIDLSLAGLEAEKIQKIVGGAGHSLILDDSGQVYSCGWNDKGQAGTPESSSRFRRLESLAGHKIVDVACGWDSSMAITERGELFAWGSNSHGQLGLPRLGSVGTPTKVELDQPIERLAMGLRHSALVTRHAKLLVSGAGSKGQLGVELAAARSSQTFVEVSDLQNVDSVACGQHHTVASTRDGQIFAWGDNRHGQLGVDPELCKTTWKPRKIDICKRVAAPQRVQCGWTHSAVLTYDKKIFFWGRNTYGQLGRRKTTPNEEYWKLQAPVTSMNIQQMAIGSEHNIALTEDKTVLSWGWNEHGNCGNGSNEDVFEPTNVILPEATGVLVAAGAGHSFAVIAVNR